MASTAIWVLRPARNNTHATPAIAAAIRLLPEPIEDSYERLLHRISLPHFMLNTSDVLTVAPVWDWLRAAHPFHSIASNRADVPGRGWAR